MDSRWLDIGETPLALESIDNACPTAYLSLYASDMQIISPPCVKLSSGIHFDGISHSRP